MRNQKGITLLALVLTIIVLIILAMVSIFMLSGNLLTNPSVTQADIERETAIKKIEIALQAIKSEALANSLSDSNYNAISNESTIALTDSAITGITSGEAGYTVNISENFEIITIKYDNDVTGVTVSGTINLTGPSGGTITPVTITVR